VSYGAVRTVAHRDLIPVQPCSFDFWSGRTNTARRLGLIMRASRTSSAIGNEGITQILREVAAGKCRLGRLAGPGHFGMRPAPVALLRKHPVGQQGLYKPGSIPAIRAQ
jgi:hypothetical protein